MSFSINVLPNNPTMIFVFTAPMGYEVYVFMLKWALKCTINRFFFEG